MHLNVILYNGHVYATTLSGGVQMKTMMVSLVTAIIGVIFTVEESSAINKDIDLAFVRFLIRSH